MSNIDFILLLLPKSQRMFRISFISPLSIHVSFSIIPIKLYIVRSFSTAIILSSWQFTVTKPLLDKNKACFKFLSYRINTKYYYILKFTAQNQQIIGLPGPLFSPSSENKKINKKICSEKLLDLLKKSFFYISANRTFQSLD